MRARARVRSTTALTTAERSRRGPERRVDRDRGRIRRARGVDDAEPVGLRARELEVATAHALVEGERLGVETVDPARALALVGAAATPRGLGGQVEEQGAVGPAAAGGDLGDALDRFGVDAAPRALVGARRVGEPVAEHQAPRGERRIDHLDQVLAPAGEDEQQLEHAVHRAETVVQEDRPDRLPELGAAGLPGDLVGDAQLGEAARDAQEVGRLATAVQPLESHELGHGPGTLARAPGAAVGARALPDARPGDATG